MRKAWEQSDQDSSADQSEAAVMVKRCLILHECTCAWMLFLRHHQSSGVWCSELHHLTVETRSRPAAVDVSHALTSTGGGRSPISLTLHHELPVFSSNFRVLLFLFHLTYLFYLFPPCLFSPFSLFVTSNVHPCLCEIWIIRGNFLLFHIPVPGEGYWIKEQKKSGNFTLSLAPTTSSPLLRLPNTELLLRTQTNVHALMSAQICLLLDSMTRRARRQAPCAVVRQAYLWGAISWRPPPCRPAAGDSWGPARGQRRTPPGRRHDGPGTAGQPLDESRPAWKRKSINILIHECFSLCILHKDAVSFF